jgi:hypothetical protein
MPKFVATTTIEHNGKRYEEGATMTLESEHADPLMAVGAIVEFDVAESRRKRATKRSEGDMGPGADDVPAGDLDPVSE